MTTFKINIDPKSKFSREDLSEYPGGVNVSVGLFAPASGVIIVPDGVTQWSYDLPTAKLSVGESLVCVCERIAELVRRLGVGFSFGEPHLVQALVHDRGLYVLLLAKCTISRRPMGVELADNIHKFSGLTSANRVAQYLPLAVGWGSTYLQAA